MSTSRFNFSQGGAEQIPTILRIFGRGVPFAGRVGGGGWPRKENYKSFDEACCVLKKKGHGGRGRGLDGVGGSRRASSREIQLPLNKLIHCRRPSATFSVEQRSNNPLLLPSSEPLDTFHLLSFFLPFPILSFFLFLKREQINLNIGYFLICRRELLSSLFLSFLKREERKRGGGRTVSIKFDPSNE